MVVAEYLYKLLGLKAIGKEVFPFITPETGDELLYGAIFKIANLMQSGLFCGERK